MQHEIVEGENGLIERIIHFADHHNDRLYTNDKKYKLTYMEQIYDDWGAFKRDIRIKKTKAGLIHPFDEGKEVATARIHIISTETGPETTIWIKCKLTPGTKEEEDFKNRINKELFHNQQVEITNSQNLTRDSKFIIKVSRRKK